MQLPEVILASPSWSLNGPNVFAASLARGLNQRGIPAHILITRPDWSDSKPLPAPDRTEVRNLPVPRFAALRTRWRVMRDYLIARSPCVYIPNYDFGHSCISPELPSEVAVVGVVHSDDPQHYEHASRLGAYWNAIVAVSPEIEHQIRFQSPTLAARLSVIPYGVAAASAIPERPVRPDGPLRVIYAGRLDENQKRVLDLPRVIRAVQDLGNPVCLTIAGAGPAEERLKSLCSELGVYDKIRFLGSLDGGALAD